VDSSIAGILGLHADQVSTAVANQVVIGNLQYRERDRGLSLTLQGRETVRTLVAVQPVLRPLPLVFDRLTWSIVDYPKAMLKTKQQAIDEGMILLPAARSARVELSDVTPAGINTLLARRAGKLDVEVLRVRAVTRTSYRYMPVKLLVYGDAARADIQLAVCVDSDLSPGHDSALQRVNAVESLKITVGPAAERPLLPAALEDIRMDSSEVAQHLTQASQASPMLTSSGVVDPIPSLHTVPVRSLSVFEHSDLLAKSLDDASKRLLIISPWVKRGVVNRDFTERLGQRLRQGVRVHIAHGYGPDDLGSDEDALRRLLNLQRRHPEGFTLARLKDTHAKILICDGLWVSTSFNWLSFRGDPKLPYRMEEGTLVKIPVEVDKAYDRYLRMIEEQRID
jgi:hypothetical protein